MRKRPTQATVLAAKAKPLKMPERPALKQLEKKMRKRKAKDPHGFEKKLETPYEKEYRLLGELLPIVKQDPIQNMYQTREFQNRREQLKRLIPVEHLNPLWNRV